MNTPALDVKKAWLSRELKHERQLFRAQFSLDGKFIAAGGQDKLVHVWELEGDKKKTLNAHKTWVSSLAFHPKGQRLFTADYLGVIHCWSYEEGGKPQWTIPNADQDNVRALVVTPDGKYLFSAGDDAIIKVWNPANGKPITRLEGHTECIFSLTVSPDGKYLVSGDLLGSVRQWNISDWKPVCELNAKLLHTRLENFIADVGGARSLAFSKDGKLLAVGGMKEAKSNAFCPGKPTVLIFDWASGKQKIELGIKGKSDGPFNALRFLEDGTLAGHTEILHTNSELTFWKTDTPDPLHSITNGSGYDLSLHPDGRQLLVPTYVSGGASGNGARKRHREKYDPNGTNLKIFSLSAKPAENKKAG
jgi:WD40 repeat protein